MCITQVSRILAVVFKALLHLLRLGVKLFNAVLKVFRIIENDEPARGKIVQDCSGGMQVGQVKSDVIKRAAMAQFLQVTIPALPSVAMQYRAIELLEFSGRLWPV